MKKIQVVDKNLQKIKNEILKDYTGEFEMVGKLSIGDQIRQTHIRFKYITDYDDYINSIGQVNNQKMLFSMVIFHKSILFNLI